MELALLTQGQPVPVSPRDNHVIHLDTLKGPIEQAGMELAQNPSVMPIIQALLDHAAQHIDMAQKSGVNPEELQDDIQQLEAIQQAIQQVQALDQQAAAVQEASAQLGEPVPAV